MRSILTAVAPLAIATAISTAGRAAPDGGSGFVWQTTWAGNTFGGTDAHVQNYITDMSVDPDGTVHTKSNWDEGGTPNGKYKNGVPLGNESSSSANAQRAVAGNGDVWTIQNFYGRFMLNDPSPVSSSQQPYVAGPNGQSITDVVDPTAIAFDNQGRLMVAENGPDQQIRIYKNVATAPVLDTTFGAKGGIYGGVDGAMAPAKLYGVRGLGADGAGNVYVASCGFMSQVGGGTDLRSFSPSGALSWRLLGISFVNSADFDPAGDGRDVYLGSEHVRMDYTQPTAQEWSLASETIDPFKYPDDPRLMMAIESAFIRRIGGNRYLFLTNMYAEFLAVYRFDGEIAVPAAFFTVGWDGQWNKYAWQMDKRPTYAAGGTERWLWRDENGDGAVQASEFSTYDVGYRYLTGIDVDDDGTVRIGSRKLITFPANGVDAHGVPNYAVSTSTVVDSPVSDNGGDITRLRYLAASDTMFMSNAENFPSFDEIVRFDQFSGARSTAYTIHVLNDSNHSPAAWTADEDYVYVAWSQQGGFTGKVGEVAVYDAKTGIYLESLTPGPEVQEASGWIDLRYALNSFKRSNGERLLAVEEDWMGKVLIYRFCPGTCGPEPAVPDSTDGGNPAADGAGGGDPQGGAGVVPAGPTGGGDDQDAAEATSGGGTPVVAAGPAVGAGVLPSVGSASFDGCGCSVPGSSGSRDGVGIEGIILAGIAALGARRRRL